MITTPVIRSVNRVSVEGIAAAIDAAKTADTGDSISAVQEAALMYVNVHVLIHIESSESYSKPCVCNEITYFVCKINAQISDLEI